jgi:hypothetical protein
MVEYSQEGQAGFPEFVDCAAGCSAKGAGRTNNPWVVAEGSLPSCPENQNNVSGRGAVIARSMQLEFQKVHRVRLGRKAQSRSTT